MRSTTVDIATDTHRAEEFSIRIPQPVLDDLHARLARTRWLDDTRDSWELGLSIPYLRELVRYWQHEFDWRAQEAMLNRFAHYRAMIDGRHVHFIHERGRGSKPLPIVLTHGFPDSFLRFMKIIPMLADPASHGGSSEDAFDVVVPSLPGFAFSDRAEEGKMIFHVHDVWHRLMTETLGFTRYGAHGGDWGSLVTELLGRDHAKSVVGIHLTDVPFYHGLQPPKEPSAKEKKYLEDIKNFQKEHGAYAMIQGSQPHVVAAALNDSPAGLAAWLVEKFRRWSDCEGDVEKRFTKDELLANVALYWVTSSIDSAFMPYYDVTHAGAMTWIKQAAKKLVGSSDVPAGFAQFPKDLTSPPREWAERFFNVQRWTEMPRGGHFAALEEPELLVKEIREFFRPLREL